MWRSRPTEGLPASCCHVELLAERKGHGSFVSYFLSQPQTSQVPAGLSVDSGSQNSLSIWCSVIVFIYLFG